MSNFVIGEGTGVGKGQILAMVGNDRFGFRHPVIYNPALKEISHQLALAKFQFTPSKTLSTGRKLFLFPLDPSTRALFFQPNRLLLRSKEESLHSKLPYFHTISHVYYIYGLCRFIVISSRLWQRPYRRSGGN
jgi:hypothetical protein